eukprot:9669-Heterococcus_DN1.PRE.2
MQSKATVNFTLLRFGASPKKIKFSSSLWCCEMMLSTMLLESCCTSTSSRAMWSSETLSLMRSITASTCSATAAAALSAVSNSSSTSSTSSSSSSNSSSSGKAALTVSAV